MALRWLKPMEQGFDVKIVASLHGGCMRLLVPANAGINEVADLKGKIIGVSEMNSPSKNFFSIIIKKAGLDPNVDVEFKQFPGPLLPIAIEKGEAHALAGGDPNTYLWLKDGKLKELTSNLAGEYATRACCIAGGEASNDQPISMGPPRFQGIVDRTGACERQNQLGGRRLFDAAEGDIEPDEFVARRLRGIAAVRNVGPRFRHGDAEAHGD
jgi:hypothetical protein